MWSLRLRPECHIVFYRSDLSVGAAAGAGIDQNLDIVPHKNLLRVAALVTLEPSIVSHNLLPPKIFSLLRGHCRSCHASLFGRASCNNRFHRHLPDRICRQRKCPVPYCFHPLFSCRFNCCLHYNIFISSGQQQSPYISVTGVSQSDLLWGWKCAKELQISVYRTVSRHIVGGDL